MNDHELSAAYECTLCALIARLKLTAMEAKIRLKCHILRLQIL